MFSRQPPVISVCVPVFNSEAYLLRCLNSVKNQTLPTGLTAKKFFEIIIVNDGSKGVSDSGETAKRIVKKFSKTVPFPVKYLEHSENKGLLEARRTAVYEAAGKYIFLLDSDDTLPPESLSLLYTKAEETSADIVQGKAAVFESEEYLKQIEIDENRLAEIHNQINERINKISETKTFVTDVFSDYFLEQKHSGFLWGKLYKRELYLEALNHIPPVYCTFAEDILQYFWLSYEAKSYIGIESVVYNYSLNTGITSATIITDLSRWEKVCSTASVFTAIYTELDEKQIQISEEAERKLALSCQAYLANNLRQLKKTVVPELQKEAYEMLCEYWGKDFVQRISSMVDAE